MVLAGWAEEEGWQAAPKGTCATVPFGNLGIAGEEEVEESEKAGALLCFKGDTEWAQPDTIGHALIPPSRRLYLILSISAKQG